MILLWGLTEEGVEMVWMGNGYGGVYAIGWPARQQGPRNISRHPAAQDTVLASCAVD